jgi:hypothetical protein
MIDAITNSLDTMRPKELTTIILAMAKIVQNVQSAKHRRRMNIYHEAFNELLLDDKSTPRDIIFDRFCKAADETLRHFDARCLANLAYAYALLGYDPKFDDGTTLFSNIAVQSSWCLEGFEPQNFSNMLWAYATLKVPNPGLFQSLGDYIITKPDLNEFQPQELANMVWAYATTGMDHPHLFQKVGDCIVASNKLRSFKPQELANIVWAYATLNRTHYALLGNIGDNIIALDNLKSFNPQALSNTVWAYATLNVQHTDLFRKVGDHIVDLNDLKAFKPQAIANTAWAFGTLDIQHSALFKKMGDHIHDLEGLESFIPQALSNTVWAYATLNVQHPALFRKIGDHITQRGDLKLFKPQALSNIVWAYATLNVQHPGLFSKIGDSVVMCDNLQSFNPQLLSNVVWAYATSNALRIDLFESIGAAIAERDNYQSFEPQHIANIAWSFAVANVDAPSVFNDDFMEAIFDRMKEFGKEDLRQLHQWHLWQAGERSYNGLSELMQEQCRDAFINAETRSSAFQREVVSELIIIGLDPTEEYLTQSGYRLDALVQINGNMVGVEVDGPSHFIDRTPTARTLLKHRQVTMVDGIPLVSVPYWEWQNLADRKAKQQHLQSLLGLGADKTKKVSLDHRGVHAATPTHLESLTIPQLKEMLRSKGLKVGGRKAELIKRLVTTT